MEEVWLKTEPIDDEFGIYVPIKSEAKFKPPTITPITIKEEEPDFETSEGIECVQSTGSHSSKDRKRGERKFTTKGRVNRDEKESVVKVSQSKQDRKEESIAKGSSKLNVQMKSRAESREQKQLNETSSNIVTGNKAKRKPVTCDQCGKTLMSHSGLKRHKLLHSGEKPHVCTEPGCGKAFTQSSTLKLHYMMHTGERRFFCEECGAKFSSKYYLNIHQRSKHTGERPFVCDECGDGFKDKRDLARHKLTHTNEKRYECEECGAKFYESLLLKSHKKTHVAHIAVARMLL